MRIKSNHDSIQSLKAHTNANTRVFESIRVDVNLFSFLLVRRRFQCYAVFLCCVFSSSNVLRVYDFALGFCFFKNSLIICCVCVCRVASSNVNVLNIRPFIFYFYLDAVVRSYVRYNTLLYTVTCIISISFNQSQSRAFSTKTEQQQPQCKRQWQRRQ